MKVSITGMLIFLVVVVAAPLVYFNGGSEYLQKLFFSRQPAASVKPKFELNKDVVYAPVTTDKKVKVYKWQDKNGVWQFGNAPPPGLAGVESMTLQPDMNIMKSIDVPGKETVSDGHSSGVVSMRKGQVDEKSANRKKDKDGIGISQDSLDNPYAPESITELMNSSKNIQNMLNNRHQQQSSK